MVSHLVLTKNPNWTILGDYTGIAPGTDLVHPVWNSGGINLLSLGTGTLQTRSLKAPAKEDDADDANDTAR